MKAKILNIILLTIIITTIITGCSKQEYDDKLYTRNNLHLLPNGSNTSVDIYYNLKTNRIAQQNDQWDIRFNWIQNYQISANPSSQNNPGRLNFIDKPFKDVTLGDIMKKFGGAKNTTEEFYKNFVNLTNFGLNTDTEPGWLQKDKNNILTPIKDRTLILITPTYYNSTNKKLYIIEIKSVYKNAPTNPTSNDKEAFISFLYKEIETQGIITL